MKLQNKKIGILDGMGAFAGARFFQLVLEKIAANRLPFPEIILDAVPVDDFISDSAKIKPALTALSARVRHFNRQHTSIIVMACNTAHLIHPELAAVSKSPFPSLIDLVCHRVTQAGINTVGILASPTTLNSKLYENRLVQLGITTVIPDPNFQKLLENIIRAVLSNSINHTLVSHFELETKKFISLHHLQGLILGCTELPLVFPKDRFKTIKIFDSLDILADSLIDHIKC